MLSTRTAREVMSTSPITLAADEPVDEAIRLLQDNDLTGAPVLDASGRVIGVLTLRDVARIEHLVDGRLETHRAAEAPLADALGDAGDDAGEREEEDLFEHDGYGSERAEPDHVADWMNPDYVAVDPGEPLPRVCERMLEAGVHRALVLEQDCLIGIVSSTDVVRAVAQLGRERAHHGNAKGERGREQA